MPTPQELVTRIIDNLGLRTTEEDAPQAPDEATRHAQQPLVRELIHAAADEADTWLLPLAHPLPSGRRFRVVLAGRRWDAALTSLASLSRLRDLHADEVLMQAIASAGLKQYDSAVDLLGSVDASTLGSGSRRVHRAVSALVYHAAAYDEASERLAKQARQSLRVAEADSPEIRKLLTISALELPAGTHEDVDLRLDPQDPWSKIRVDEERRAAVFAEAMEEIDQLVGLQTLRNHITAFVNQMRVAKAREKHQLAKPTPAGHWIFAGPPGTGKTTVARIMAKLLYGLEKIDRPEVLERRPADMIGEHLGQTAPRTRREASSALGGVLFIDEAYQLNDPEGAVGGDKFGREAVTELLAMMENHRDRFVVIAAGYPAEMERLMETNDGLRSRFNQRLDFTTYTPDELTEMIRVMAQHDSNVLTTFAEGWLSAAFAKLSPEQIDQMGNGRFVRNLYESLLVGRDTRLSNESPDGADWSLEQLTTINDRDVRDALLKAADLPYPGGPDAPLRAPREYERQAADERLAESVKRKLDDARTVLGIEPFQWREDLDEMAHFWAVEYAKDTLIRPVEFDTPRLPYVAQSAYGAMQAHLGADRQEEPEPEAAHFQQLWTSEGWTGFSLNADYRAAGLSAWTGPDGRTTAYLIMTTEPAAPEDEAPTPPVEEVAEPDAVEAPEEAHRAGDDGSDDDGFDPKRDDIFG